MGWCFDEEDLTNQRKKSILQAVGEAVVNKGNYQTEHLLTGLSLLPNGHFQSLANSGLLLKGPLTLNLAGE